MLRVQHHGEIVAEIPNRRWRIELRSTTGRTRKPLRPAPMEAPAVHEPESDARSGDAAGVGGSLLQALDLAAVRLSGAHQYARRAGLRMRRSCASRRRATSLAMSLDGNARYCYLSPREGAQADRGGVLPQSRGGGRGAGGRDEQSEFRKSGAAGDHGAAGGSDRGYRRCLPAFRNTDHGRQRQPV